MISLAVLSGGNSSRMGQDKGLMPFLGRPLIQRVLERISSLADEIFISTNEPQKYAFLGIPTHTDILPNCGSLGGLYTSLLVAKYPLVAAAACDLPFVSSGIFSHAISLLSGSNADVVIPRTSHGLEPLHAVYRRETCLPIINNALKNHQNKIIEWFKDVTVLEISTKELLAFDPQGITFWNLNTPEEFMRAEEKARQET